MKLRIVQDHDAAAQPWYRLEQYLQATDAWYVVASGPDYAYVKGRFEKMSKTGSAGNDFTVLEERDV